MALPLAMLHHSEMTRHFLILAQHSLVFSPASLYLCSMTRQEAEQQWCLHGNEVLVHDADYQEAERHAHHVGVRVAWAYAALVGSLLAFCVGFYYWLFRFFFAICLYVVFLTIAGLALRVILRYSVKDDHLSELVRRAHDRYVTQLLKDGETLEGKPHNGKTETPKLSKKTSESPKTERETF